MGGRREIASPKLSLQRPWGRGFLRLPVGAPRHSDTPDLEPFASPIFRYVRLGADARLFASLRRRRLGLLRATVRVLGRAERLRLRLCQPARPAVSVRIVSTATPARSSSDTTSTGRGRCATRSKPTPAKAGASRGSAPITSGRCASRTAGAAKSATSPCPTPSRRPRRPGPRSRGTPRSSTGRGPRRSG